MNCIRNHRHTSLADWPCQLEYIDGKKKVIEVNKTGEIQGFRPTLQGMLKP